ncbi:D-alanine--D-alanine ligase family protein [Granulicoccus phenolivorans]|uniref:D-alanine--D-alanine ligase family protein n=1 Tax=Granulicoccus phenolivorans TaxID=266854 RepID=UPI001FDF8D4F|nr:D-alanine--D-alanine ligase family protein [Granulicoccus phenolivorans]
MTEPTTVTEPTRKPVVALVFGGDSSEHGVSCLTAAGVANAIDSERYDVIGIGVTRTGRWTQIPIDRVRGLRTVGQELPAVPEDVPEAVWLREGPGRVSIATRDGDRLIDEHPVDAVFALLHGTFGEDGTVQGMFEMLGLRYVGAGVTASAVGMDKIVMKQVIQDSGLPVGPWTAVLPRQWAEQPDACRARIADLGYPVYVKPARGGSSLGISRVTGPDELDAAIEHAQSYDPRVIVEQGFVGAREIECGVLQDLNGGAPLVSSVAEIRMHTEDAFYDFEAKYLPEKQVSLDVPADLPAEVAAQVQEIGVRTFEAVSCEGLARVDCFLTADGVVVVNEINTMPGFTEFSMFPRVWAHAGVAYPDLIDHLITLALTRPLGLR